MGLCPDCESEGETVSYIGASRAEVVDGVEPDEEEGEEGDDGAFDEVEICDLCEEEYVPED